MPTACVCVPANSQSPVAAVFLIAVSVDAWRRPGVPHAEAFLTASVPAGVSPLSTASAPVAIPP